MQKFPIFLPKLEKIFFRYFSASFVNNLIAVLLLTSTAKNNVYRYATFEQTSKTFRYLAIVISSPICHVLWQLLRGISANCYSSWELVCFAYFGFSEFSLILKGFWFNIGFNKVEICKEQYDKSAKLWARNCTQKLMEKNLQNFK